MCRSGLCTSTPAGGAMSAAVTSPGPCLRRYMTTGSSCSETPAICRRDLRRPGPPPGPRLASWAWFLLLLRVQLDDELLLHLRVDLGANRHGVHEDAHLVRDDLQPGRHLALAGLGPGDD